ncbi:hypothetical protein INR49_030703 [Caranx melampygus]|nr:hypothetical protein INR49_030703 [Caranx melampygus]
MQGNGGVYAVKRRRKPVQKNVKPPPVKTNPSKRHRDRLNVELDRLTGLLPFSDEVRGRLDKLSVLRLSVGFLKRCSRKMRGPLLSSLQTAEMDTDGTVFYTSHTIQDFLGFHQSDVVHQSVFDLIHMDDREMFKCQLHFAFNPSETSTRVRAKDGRAGSKSLSSSQSLLPQYLPPENSSFLERSFCCRLRCLLDNTSGFLALNFNGRLKYLHLQGNTGADGSAAPPQLALFAIATPVQTPSVMEIRTKTLIFQTKHRMDFAPLGIDTRGKLALGYTEVELVTPGSGYQFIHAADMMYCADNHLRMIKTGDSGLSIFRLLTKTGLWLWVQASARIVFKGGRPDFIIARQKALTNEEGEEHLRQRRQQLPFNLATGEGVLYDVSLDAFSFPGPPGASPPDPTEPTTEKQLDPASLLGALCRQDHSIYTQSEKPSPQLPVLSEMEDADCEQLQPAVEQAFLDSHALLSVPGQMQTLQKSPVTTDFTSEAMIESLEQILRDIGDGGIEGLEVEESELKDWENTLIKMNKEREDAERELNHNLANDVFSYVEEALRKETGGLVVQSSDQTGRHVSGSLSTQGEHPGFSNGEPRWQPVTDMTTSWSGFGDEAQLGNILGNVGNPKGAAEVVSHRSMSTLTPTQCRKTLQGSHHCGNEMSTQSCVTHQPWLPSTHNGDNIHTGHQSGLELMNQSAQYSQNHAGSQQTFVGPQPRGPPVWQQLQQLPQRFHHHTLSHSSHTPGSVNSAAQSFHPQTQRLSGSCMYGNREGHMPNAAPIPARHNGPLLGPTCSTGPAYVAGAPRNAPTFTLSHPAINQGVMSSSNTHRAACTDVGSISLGHVRGADTNVGTFLPNLPAEKSSLQSSFFCWNGNAQIPKIPLNGAVDAFAFPARPTGSINLSQNTAP